MTERSFVIIKPDAVSRGLAGQVLARYEAKGLKIVRLELRQIDAEFAAQHYAEHVGRAYYDALAEFMTSGPLIAMVLEGPQAIDAIRAVNGATNGVAAAPGSIRGDLSLSNRENIVHASDSPESAAKEIALWFPGL